MKNEVCASLKDLFEILQDNISKEDVICAKSTSQIVSSLIRERLKNNLTQTEFAEILGVKQSMVSRWESGSSNFTIKTLSKIAATLDLDLYVNLTQHKDIEFTNLGNYRTTSIRSQSHYNIVSEKTQNTFNMCIAYTPNMQRTMWKEVNRC